MRVGPERKLSMEELMLLNCGVGEESESPLDSKETQPVNPKRNQLLIFIRVTDGFVFVFTFKEGLFSLLNNGRNVSILKDPRTHQSYKVSAIVYITIRMSLRR